MMYSPRSFPYLQHSPPSPRSTSRKTTSVPKSNTTVLPRPVNVTEKPAAPASHPRTIQPAATMHSHSQPVIIPPRTPASMAAATQTLRVRGQNGGRPKQAGKGHSPDAIPPAVAALLAVTAIPKMPARRRKPAAERRISMDELIQEWKQDDSDVPCSVVGSPLDLLLGRVEESEDYYGSLQSLDQEKDLFDTSRSISSDSIVTLPPSLEFDNPSYASHWDNISIPESISRRLLPERREKIVSSPPIEDCVLDHPLLHFALEECEQVLLTDIPEIVDAQQPTSERFKSFKSNLTASLQALKSAAKSFSNFTAPSVPPEDLLTRSLLSPKFTSEMRPKLVEGLPSPALRRYLNPHSVSISPTELSMHLHDSISIDADADIHAPMIQMQTYDRRGRASKSRKRGNDPYSEGGRALNTPPIVRQREPRENGDFLRVIVLEMNMRRVGKLDAKAVGKARIWLPPRKAGSPKPLSVQSTSGVPERWIGVQAG